MPMGRPISLIISVDLDVYLTSSIIDPIPPTVGPTITNQIIEPSLTKYLIRRNNLNNITSWPSWRPTSPFPKLSFDEVHVWSTRLDCPAANVEACRNLLSQGELKRADRFRFDVHRNRYTVGRAVLRLLISHYTQIPVEKIRFDYGPLGKPSLPNNGQEGVLCFNNTDSGDVALYAFSWNRELGVDLECIPREVKHDAIAERKFTQAEAAAIRAFPEAQRQQAFLACWTRKEAYGKALGVGIRYPLDSVEMCCELGKDQMTVDHDQPSDGPDYWSLQQLRPSPETVATLVSAGKSCPMRYWHWPQENVGL